MAGHGFGVARTTPPVVRYGHRYAAGLLGWKRPRCFERCACWPRGLALRAAPLPWPPLTARCLRSAILALLASEPGSMAQATPRRTIPTRSRRTQTAHTFRRDGNAGSVLNAVCRGGGRFATVNKW